MSRGTGNDRGTPVATPGRDVNTTDHNTSGSADHAGTPTGTSSTARDVSRGTGSSGTPTDTQSGNNHSNALGGAAGPATGGNWDRSCFISPTSSSFVLQIQDGRTMKIDDAGNSRISSQLRSTGRVSTKNKVFRVKVTGSAEGDTIHLSDIQM